MKLASSRVFVGSALRPRAFAAAAACVALAVSGDARADEPARSYAEQTLIADALSIGTVVAGVASGDEATFNVLAGVGLGTFALATPVIHGVHGEWGAAGGSLAMRVLGVPAGTLAGAGLGLAMCSPAEGNDWGALGCFLAGGLVGMGVSAVVISTIDATLLARETPRRPSLRSAVRVVPMLGPKGSAALGVTGTF